MLPSGLLMVHDACRCGEDNEAKLTRWKKSDDPLLEITELNIVAWVDDTSLVDATIELDNNLAAAVVVDLLEFANVACTLLSADVAKD